jgi:hypothetical protein
MTTLPTTKYAMSGDVHIAYQVVGERWLSAKDNELIMGRALCTWLGWKLPG